VYVEERKEFVRDAFQDYLRQLSERDVQGSAGLAILKAELLRRARSIAGTDAPQEILISDLIIQ
jgi:flagellar FliL protein